MDDPAAAAVGWRFETPTREANHLPVSQMEICPGQLRYIEIFLPAVLWAQPRSSDALLRQNRKSQKNGPDEKWPINVIKSNNACGIWRAIRCGFDNWFWNKRRGAVSISLSCFLKLNGLFIHLQEKKRLTCLSVSCITLLYTLLCNVCLFFFLVPKIFYNNKHIFLNMLLLPLPLCFFFCLSIEAAREMSRKRKKKGHIQKVAEVAISDPLTNRSTRF